MGFVSHMMYFYIKPWLAWTGSPLSLRHCYFCVNKSTFEERFSLHLGTMTWILSVLFVWVGGVPRVVYLKETWSEGTGKRAVSRALVLGVGGGLAMSSPSFWCWYPSLSSSVPGSPLRLRASLRSLWGAGRWLEWFQVINKEDCGSQSFSDFPEPHKSHVAELFRPRSLRLHELLLRLSLF